VARQKPKRRKKKKKKGKGGVGSEYSSRGSGGVMQSMLGGFRRAAGAEPGKGGKKRNLFGNMIWILLIAAATAFLVNSYTN